MHAGEVIYDADATAPVVPVPQTVREMVAQTLCVRPDRVVEVLCKSLLMVACERLNDGANAWIDRFFASARS